MFLDLDSHGFQQLSGSMGSFLHAYFWHTHVSNPETMNTVTGSSWKWPMHMDIVEPWISQSCNKENMVRWKAAQKDFQNHEVRWKAAQKFFRNHGSMQRKHYFWTTEKNGRPVQKRHKSIVVYIHMCVCVCSPVCSENKYFISYWFVILISINSTYRQQGYHKIW